MRKPRSTDQEIRDFLASRGPVTREELEDQRLSYIMGTMGKKNRMTKEQLKAFLEGDRSATTS